MTRIAQNGAQMMAMVHVIGDMIGFEETRIQQTITFIARTSVERQQSLVADHPTVTEFWDTVDYLNALNESLQVNHSVKPDLLAVNLPHVEACVRLAGIQIPLRSELNRLLPKTCRHEYLGKKNVRSKLTGSVVKCHIFINKDRG